MADMQLIVLDTGSVEYSAEEASVDIDELISALEDTKEEGAEYVTLDSGNSRGAKFQTLRAGWEWA